MQRLTEKLRGLRQWSCLDGPPQTESSFREIAPTVVTRAKARTKSDRREQTLDNSTLQKNSTLDGSETTRETVHQDSALLRLPRELHDIILSYVLADEPRPHPLNTKSNEPQKYFIISKSSCALICRQIYAECREALDKSAALPVAYEFEGFREPLNAVVATIHNVRFDRLMAYILSLPEEKRKAFSDVNKIRITLVFTSLYETRRANLIKWLEFCDQHNITASYRAPMSTWQDRDQTLLINIYDLFSLEGGTEEEKIFKTLQQWYALRRSHHQLDMDRAKQIIRCYRVGSYEREKRRAQVQGLRTAKTIQQSHQPVRLAELTEQSYSGFRDVIIG